MNNYFIWGQNFIVHVSVFLKKRIASFIRTNNQLEIVEPATCIHPKACFTKWMLTRTEFS